MHASEVHEASVSGRSCDRSARDGATARRELEALEGAPRVRGSRSGRVGDRLVEGRKWQYINDVQYNITIGVTVENLRVVG